MGSLNRLPVELRLQIFSHIPCLHVDDNVPVDIDVTKDNHNDFIRYLLIGDYRQRPEYLSYRAPRAKLFYETSNAWPDYVENAFFQGKADGLMRILADIFLKLYDVPMFIGPICTYPVGPSSSRWA